MPAEEVGRGEVTDYTRFRSGYRALGQPKPFAPVSSKHMLAGLLSFGLVGRACNIGDTIQWICLIWVPLVSLTACDWRCRR